MIVKYCWISWRRRKKVVEQEFFYIKKSQSLEDRYLHEGSSQLKNPALQGMRAALTVMCKVTTFSTKILAILEFWYLRPPINFLAHFIASTNLRYYQSRLSVWNIHRNQFVDVEIGFPKAWKFSTQKFWPYSTAFSQLWPQSIGVFSYDLSAWRYRSV